tara:strand:+ start:1522 stop:1995 length:474 start_codon:yes stop_codon:yes gene_type:complete
MIREFEPKDMNAILKLVREHAVEAEVDHLPVDDIFFKDVVRNALIQDNNKCFVVEKGGEIVGYSFVGLLTKLWNPTLYADVYFFYVHNSVRNKFLADSLHEATCSWAYQNGANWIEFSVALFDKEFKGRDDYVDRASTYFEHKGGVHCGNIFVQELG